ncbi:hypothetical protein BDZ94DRAFT_1305560 [Collybia nuda]|uniref:Uncharacterized protein n=1 Tax=Collybia nuda TaxID=64659 RepID=A0A9P5YD44_9AGAR|nr:hypothetical protein BDZ94DRAFT_1305560 [Collybia nuda]
MPNNVLNTVRSFVDVKAQVDNEEEDNSGEELGPGTPNDFIDDEVNEDNRESSRATRPATSAIGRHDGDTQFNEFIYGIMKRLRAYREEESDKNSDEDNDNAENEENAHYSHLAEGFFFDEEMSQHCNPDVEHSPVNEGPSEHLGLDVERLPTSEDSPLMREGRERDAVFFLLNNTDSRHQIRSAFSQDSIHGWFYIEGTMNADLSALLQSSPLIFRPRDGITGIRLEEWVSLLKMRYAEEVPSAGGWVTIRRGLYRGDVGYVSLVQNWGKLNVLLLPRLPPPQNGDSSKKLPQALELIPFFPLFHAN